MSAYHSRLAVDEHRPSVDGLHAIIQLPMRINLNRNITLLLLVTLVAAAMDAAGGAGSVTGKGLKRSGEGYVSSAVPRGGCWALVISRLAVAATQRRARYGGGYAPEHIDVTRRGVSESPVVGLVEVDR
jgi:hypothetical protein